MVIIDPPFGAKTELIWHSLERLKKRAEMLSCSVSMSFLWVFPYFMEKQVLLKVHLSRTANDFNKFSVQVSSTAPELLMADYRVSYAKHKQFKEGKDERGSIVRLFTNIDLRFKQFDQVDKSLIIDPIETLSLV